MLATLKVNPRNEVGVIVHVVSKILPCDHTAKSNYGNVNYAKTFIQGTVLNVFDKCMAGGKIEQHDNQTDNQLDNQHNNQHRFLAGTTESPARGACGWRGTGRSPSRHRRAGAGGNAGISPEVQLHLPSCHCLCCHRSQPPTMQKINNQLSKRRKKRQRGQQKYGGGRRWTTAMQRLQWQWRGRQ
jgi:hypothetical protein